MGTARMWVGALVCGAALVLTGCAVDEPTMQLRAILAAESTPTDALPGTVHDFRGDPSSSRLVGEVDGISYFVTQYLEEESGRPGFCLVLTDPSEDWVSSCTVAAGAPQLRVWGNTTGAARMVAEGYPVPDGWTQLSEFLIVKPDASS